eukprot:10761271-Alexandrium_andersonii.AAC.1
MSSLFYELRLGKSANKQPLKRVGSSWNDGLPGAVASDFQGSGRVFVLRACSFAAPRRLGVTARRCLP